MSKRNSEYIETRLRDRYQSQMTIARISFIIVGIILFALPFVLLRNIDASIRFYYLIGSAVPSILIFTAAIISYRFPKPSFLIGIIICGLFLLLNLFNLNLVGVLIWGILLRVAIQAYNSAKKMEEMIPLKKKNSDILDSEFFE